ncbi:FtsX-like permease family protein [Chitiniphilus purpureus]|uniref:FtsX-like permease family protein n=1 Tax=Chitiniphilus purpureus TaxID=2981137 RepID=A0ABY6DSP8_9NEIS|nr:FtsX-like permease family protein [Chitiniphilus sp. CD1]UXY16748.1 FtsX-like permease family protein [Chitiniphilus sp. CD1]
MSGGLLTLAWRQFLRGLRAGEHRTLIAALAVTIAALTAVGLFAGRVGALLNAEANNLLAADAVLSADHPIRPAAQQQAARLGLATSQVQTFPSMASANGDAALTTVKAIAGRYPLRGRLTLNAGRGSYAVHAAPPQGEVWIDERLAHRLKLKVGDGVRLGRLQLRVGALIEREPDIAVDFAGLQPRLIMNAAQLPQSGLLGFGSRIRYRLLVAGPDAAVAQWKQQAERTLARGERLENVRESQPQVRRALERAETFLRLVTLLAATLAGTAVLLAARRYSARQADAVALFVTLGATRMRIRALLFAELALIFGLAALIGGAVGWITQAVLALLIRDSLPGALPQPAPWPWLAACALGLVLLAGVAGPTLMQLARTPPARVLRRELVAPARLWLSLSITLAAAAAVFFWVAGSATLALYVAGGIAGALLASGLLGWLLLRVAARVVRGFAARIALRQLARRTWLSAAQLGALAVGLLGLWLLTAVERDLLSSWERRLPPDAPNLFAFNIQPDQAASFQRALAAAGVTDALLQPMIRGRWVALNGRPVEVARYEDDRARRLAEREFNLSWGEQLREDNKLQAGQPLSGASGWSVEAGLAETLGIRLGDTLTFDVAGTPVQGRVVNLRTVEWDSFRVNFFVVGTPAMFGEAPTSLITSFYLPPQHRAAVAGWSRTFPNVTFIDVGEVLGEVRRVLGLSASVLRLVFVFCLAAGVVVLLAALETSAPERRREAAVLRALGAHSRQIAAIQWWEGALIGATAGLVAGLAASATGWLVGRQVLALPVSFNLWLPAASLIAGLALAGIVTLWERRRLASESALGLLRDPG